MDAVNYIRERARMCKTIKRCAECPIHGLGCGSILKVSPEMILELVEQWSIEHPFETNGMRFLDDTREHIRTYHRWENGCKPYIEVHIEADWWDGEYKEER